MGGCGEERVHGIILARLFLPGKCLSGECVGWLTCMVSVLCGRLKLVCVCVWKQASGYTSI